MVYRTAPLSMTLEDPNPRFQGQAISLTLNISKMAADTAIFTIEDEYETVPKLSNGTTFSDLE